MLSFVGTYAKAFGQIYISDDAFLVAAATVQNVMNGTARSQSRIYQLFVKVLISHQLQDYVGSSS